MTPAELRAELARLGISQQELARRLGRDPSTIRRWLMDPAKTTNARPVPRQTAEAIRRMTRVDP